MSSPLSAVPPSFRNPAAASTFWPVFGLLIAVQLCFGLSFSSFFLLPKFVALELGGDANAIGTLTSIATLAGVLASPLLGAWLDRGRRAPFITLGATVTSIAALGFVWVDEVGPFAYALRVVQGLAFSMAFNSAATLVADIAPPARLSQALGWFGAAALSTNAIAPATAEWIADHYGWSSVFSAAAAFGALAAALSLFLREPSAPVSQSPKLGGSWRVIQKHAAVFYAMAAGGAAFGVMFTFTQPFALELGETHVSSLFLGYTLAALFVRLALGSAADRLGRLRAAIGSLSLYAVVVAATAELRPGLLLVFGLFFGLAHGVFYPALSAIAAESAERGRRGTVMTLVNAAFNLGLSITVVSCGMVARAASYEVVFLLAALVAASGVIALVRSPTRAPANPGAP